MRILALNAYHSGSHLRFLDGWTQHSRHEWTVLTLPGRHWKWRMRHAALSLSSQVWAEIRRGRRWDRLWVTDMLNLAELRGLCPAVVADLPAVVYFHENQLTYPVRDPSERDLHFGFSNFLGALAADQLWFNSAFHRDAFLEALLSLLTRMPDYGHESLVTDLRLRSRVCPPGIDSTRPCGSRNAGAVRILWAARWEHDKDPECLFRALELVEQRGVAFRLSVLGQSFPEVPDCFGRARRRFQQQIDDWGFVDDRDRYQEILARSDLIVSTAIHEFFGIAVAEAAAAGCIPVLPARLSYPELFGVEPDFFYAGSATDLADRICALSSQLQTARGRELREKAMALASRFCWTRVAPMMDDQLQQLKRRCVLSERAMQDGQAAEDATD